MSKIEVKMGQNKKTSPEDIILQPGPRVPHGGYSYIRTGRIPKRKANIERYLTWVRMTYAEDVAGSEENMTAGQTVLLNKLILLEGLARCIETTAAEVTEKTGQLYAMPTKYMSYVSAIMKLCSLLGVERKEVKERIPTPLEVASVVDSAKESETQ